MTTVLVVDDDPHLVRALRITLTAGGYTVTTAANGGTALAVASALTTNVRGHGHQAAV